MRPFLTLPSTTAQVSRCGEGMGQDWRRWVSGTTAAADHRSPSQLNRQRLSPGYSLSRLLLAARGGDHDL
eukprot:COSAG05_NODE_1787_length_4092_cov_1.788380_6_plen_70_part_00